MIRLEDIGIQDYKRKPENFEEIILLKINGQWNEYKMITNENGWQKVVIPLESGVYNVPLLDIFLLLGRI